jgi:hypothetical protein
MTDRAVESKGQEHHEEDQGPEDRARHRGDGSGVHDEHQSWSLSGNFFYGSPGSVSHVAQNREDNKSGDEAGAGVDDTGQQRVPETGRTTL